MPETANMDKMYRELVALRKEVQFIKNRMIDIELVMTSEDEELLGEALEEHKKGKTKRYEDLKKELGD
jgi:O6-methylguanine-DNA--protein-cysteine methyltransferase